MEKNSYCNDLISSITENEILALKGALKLSVRFKDVNQIILLVIMKDKTGYKKKIFDIEDLRAFFQGTQFAKGHLYLKIEAIRTFNKDWQGKKIIVAHELSSEHLINYNFENVAATIFTKNPKIL